VLQPCRHPGDAEPAEQVEQAADAVAHAEPPLHQRHQVLQPPDAGAVPLQLRSRQDQRHQRRLLAFVELLARSAARSIVQPVHAFRIVTDHGIAQRLAFHAGQPGGFRPGHPLERVGDRDHPRRRPPVLLPPRPQPKLTRRQVIPDIECTTHVPHHIWFMGRKPQIYLRGNPDRVSNRRIWYHSYNISLTERSDGTVVIKQGDGHEEFYDPLGRGNYRSRFGGIFSILVKNPDKTFTIRLKDQSHQQFSISGKLTEISDRNGNALRFSYDAEGNLTAITDTVGRTVTLDYDTHKRIIRLTDPIGRAVQYSYDADGNLASNTDPNGGVVRYSYDAADRVTRIIDQRGNTLVANTYDTAGRVVSQMNGRGSVTKFAYGTGGNTTIADPLGNITIHTHDNQLRLTKVTDPLGHTVTLTYDERNNRTRITDKNGNSTRFTYDDRGNVTAIVDPLNDTIAQTYDTTNNVTHFTDARGSTTTFQYDAKGNLTTLEDALGNVTTFIYNMFGQVNEITDARGNVTRYTYDEQGNVAELINAIEGLTRNTYDGGGRLISLTNPNGHTVGLSYDANNQLIQAVDPLGHIIGFAYDAAGNLKETTDAKGNKTRYDYDNVANLITVTDALGQDTSYAYDANNNLVRITDANGHTRSNAFDALHRLTSLTDPLGNTTQFSYDPAGNIIVITNASGTINTFTYDAANLLKKIAYADGSAVTYTYDANGNRTRMEERRGPTTYAYDAMDQLIEVRHPDGSVVHHEYDALGNQIQLTYPDGRTAVYAYDALSQLTRVSDWGGRETQYAYDLAGNLSQITYPNNTMMFYRYDAANRLVKVKNTHFRQGDNERIGGTDTIAEVSYTLDEVGNRITAVASGQALRRMTFSYKYDAISRLIAVGKRRFGEMTTREEYTYDPVGNRLSLTEVGGTVRKEMGRNFINYAYDDANRLLQAGNTSFTYDANGNRLSETNPRRAIAYTYDTADRLTGVLQNDKEVAYTYDGDGNKVEQSIIQPSTTKIVRFLNDVSTPLPVVLQQDNGNEGEREAFLYGLALISKEQSVLKPHSPELPDIFYHSDGLGSTIALTDRTGQVRAGYQYDAWGNLESKRGIIENRFLFTGEEQDPHTNLYYLRARWYDPAVGRFLTKDPFAGSVLFPQSINEYALNNPINLIDPTGEFSLRSGLKSLKSRLKTVGNAIAKGAQAVARNPVGAFVIKAGLIAGGCAVGGAVGCGLGAGLAELGVAYLRGDFDCVGAGVIFARAGIAAIFAGVSGAIGPSILKSVSAGNEIVLIGETAEVVGIESELGSTVGQQLFLKTLIGAEGAAAMSISKPRCPKRNPSVESSPLTTFNPLPTLTQFDTGMAKRAK
jgi:RHS repeat-associated protein